MKKLTILSLFILLSSFVSLSQNNPPVKHWTFTGEATEGNPTDEDWFFNILATDNGGYLGVGFSDLLNGTRVPSIAKLNAHGKMLWDFVFFPTSGPGFGGQFLDAVEVFGPNPGYVIVGAKGVGLLLPREVFIIKVDKQTGGIIWQSFIGGTGLFGMDISATGSSIEIDPAGAGDGFIIGGSLSDFLQPFFSVTKALLLRVSSLGAYIAHQEYVPAGYDWAAGRNAINVFDGPTHTGYALVGRAGYPLPAWDLDDQDVFFIQTDLNLDAIAGFPITISENDMVPNIQPGENIIVPLLTYVDMPDQSECTACTGIPPLNEDDEQERGFAVVQIPSGPNEGDFLINAEFDVYQCPVGGCPPLIFNNCSPGCDAYRQWDAVLMRIEEGTGMVKEAKNVTHFDGIDFFCPMELTADNNILLAGSHLNTNPFMVQVHLLKTDYSGNIIWERIFDDGTPVENCLFGLDVANDGSIIVAGNNFLNGEDYFAIELYSDCQVNADFTGINDIDGDVCIDFNVQPWENFFAFPRKINGTLTINNGATLTIKNSIIEFVDSRQVNDFDNMGPGGIIVNLGCTLFLQNTQLRGLSQCGQNNMWEGIQVLGDPNNPDPEIQGKVFLIDGVNICDALTGIRVGVTAFDSDGHAFTQPGSGGGIVEASDIVGNLDVLFTDNQLHLDFSSYPFPNPSSLTHTRFRSSGLLADPDFVTDDGTPIGPEIFVKIFDHETVKFDDCLFLGSTQFAEDKRGIGIFDAFSGLTVENNTVFKDLSTGILAWQWNPIKPVRIDKCEFDNVQHGITLAGVHNTKITRNLFSSTTGTFPDNFDLYMRDCHGYQIEANDFNNTDGLNQTIGIVTFNSMQNNFNNRIYRNDFTRKFLGIVPEGEHRGNPPNTSGKGLRLKCNDFTDGQFDVAVTVPPGIAQLLGFPLDQKSPAGNVFFTNCIPNTPTKQLFNVGLGFAYTHHINTPPFITEPIVGCFSPSVSLVDGGFQYVGAVACSSLLNLISPVDFFKNEITDNEAQAAQLEAQIDGGDTEGLLNSIANDPPGQAKNKLLAASPLLSDSVLIAYSESGAPAGHIMQVVLANSPVTQEVMDALNAAGLPNGIMNQINAAQTGISAREELESRIRFFQAERSLAVNALIREWVHNDSLPAAIDSIIAILQQEEGLDFKCQLASVFISKGDFASAQQVLNDLVTDPRAEPFCKLEQLRVNLRSAGLIDLVEAIKLSPFIQEQVEVISADSTVRGSVQASLLLAEAFGREVPEFIVLPLPENNKKGDTDEDKEEEEVIEEEEPEISALPQRWELANYPNPFRAETVIRAMVPQGTEGAELLITDLMGRIVRKAALQEGVNNITVGQADLDNGIYFYSIVHDGKRMITQKMVNTK